MKTTKIVLVCLAFLILMTSVIAAPPMPYPIAGKITIVGDLVPMFEVSLSTCDFGSNVDNCIEDVVTKFATDSTGSYIFALDDINPMYRTKMCNSKGVCYTGDFVKIKVCDNHPNCEVVRELTGSALLVDFELGTKEPVEIVKTVEKIVEVPVVNDKGEDVNVVIADERTTLERWIAFKGFWWITGFIAMVLVLMGTQAGKAKKMLSTLIKKHNKKGYGK
ncbi:hypothetical protein M0R04_11190 [Candidatus Dojkabacteria bacterium]|nr:hypothetical protein [Candidatus Dojkabacteria bacterium]